MDKNITNQYNKDKTIAKILIIQDKKDQKHEKDRTSGSRDQKKINQSLQRQNDKYKNKY
jgi:hypothetical protein